MQTGIQIQKFCIGGLILAASAGVPAAMAQELTYSTYLGGSRDEGTFPYFAHVAVDDLGYAYVTGRSRSNDFPVTDDSANSGGYDVFVAKLDPSSNSAADLMWATYLGGSDQEFARGVGVNSSGDVFVMGVTLSGDFPTTDGTSGPGIFVARLVPDRPTQPVEYATVIGPATQSDTESFGTLVVDDLGYAYVISTTDSPGFPVVPAERSEGGSFAGGARDAIVTKLAPMGAIVYSRFLGGLGDDAGRSIAVDAWGDAYVTGQTSSTDFPTTTDAFQTRLNGPTDAFVVHLDSAGDIVWSSFLGGSANDMGRDGAIAVDAVGKIYVTGRTQSDDFPVRNAFDPSKNKQNDAFITLLDPSLSGDAGLVYSTYLGGSSGERGQSIDVDAAGNAYVVGRTGSKDFPTTPDAWSTTLVGKHDVWLAKLDTGLADQASLISSTYFGGSRDDGSGRGVLFDFQGNTQVYLSGDTWSRNFPTTAGAYAESSAGSSDAFLSILQYAVPPPPECVFDGDCQDGVTCTADTCVSGNCVFTPNDASCQDNELFCDGPEVCDPADGCVSSGDPCPTGVSCNESTNSCDGPVCQPKNGLCAGDGDCCSDICKRNGRCR